jgi:tetratricopeptide (TPR) repeat protein
MSDLNKAFGGLDAEIVMKTVSDFLDVFLRESGLENHKIVQGMKAGNTAAQTLGLTRDDLNVLYTLGFNALNSGDVQKAYDVFFQLITIDPLEAKNHYLMGVIQQAKGDHKLAADMFVNFLALDATNPDGYLRYGETQIALGNRQMAREAFECAEAEAAKGNGDEITLAEARAKLAMLNRGTVQ